MIEDLLVPLVAVALAEVGDKTQLSILLLSSRTKNHLHLLLGVVLAFLIVDGVAVLIGSSAASLLPIGILKILSGTMFITFGLLMIRQKDGERGNRLYSENSFLSGFITILITEWGDKTQIASGLFATNYNAVMVLAGTMTALTLLSIAAIFLGKHVLNRIDKNLMAKISGIAFILLGLSFFLL